MGSSGGSSGGGTTTWSGIAGDPTLPTGAIAQTILRPLANLGPSVTSGTLALTPIYVATGNTIGHITFVSNGAATSPTHWWFGLYDNNRNQLAVTADQTNTAWAADVTKTLAIATTAAGAASTFTTTYTGVHYVGIMMAASSPVGPWAYGALAANDMDHLAPIVSGNSDTGQTTPPAFPHQAGAIATYLAPFYAYLS